MYTRISFSFDPGMVLRHENVPVNRGLPKSTKKQKVAIKGFKPLAAHEYKVDFIGC